MAQNLTYTQCGDYYFPDIRLTHTETQSLGKYGRMRRIFLEQNQPILFNDMILNETLFLHLWEVQQTCIKRMELLMEELLANNPDTHEAIIPEDIFEKVQVLRQNRQRRSKTGKTSLFSGMAYCTDCGEKLYYCTANNFEKRQDFFECSTHRKNDEKCKSHYIRAVVLEDMVRMHMETVISYILHYKDHFRAVVQEQLKIESDEKI